MLMIAAIDNINGSDLAAVAALVGLIITAGGAFFFVGQLSGKFNGLESKVKDEGLRARSDRDRCMVERGNVETKLFDKVGNLESKLVKVATLIEELLKDRAANGN